MNELLKQTGKSISYWRLAIWKVVNGGLIVAIMAFIAGTAGRTWSTMDFDDKTLIILTALVAVFKNIDGFLDQTIANLRAGKNPVTGFDTDQIVKP